jgi:hypothetical protein
MNEIAHILVETRRKRDRLDTGKPFLEQGGVVRFSVAKETNFSDGRSLRSIFFLNMQIRKQISRI